MQISEQLHLQFILPFRQLAMVLCGFILAPMCLLGKTKQTSKLDISSVFEIESSIRRGSTFLLSQQNPNGSWSDSVETTALCNTAIIRSIETDVPGYTKSVSDARTFLLNFLVSNLPNSSSHPVDFKILHSMAISLVPLAVLDNPADYEIIEKTRRLLKYTFIRIWDTFTTDQQHNTKFDLQQVHDIFEVLAFLKPHQQFLNYQQVNSQIGNSDTWKKLADFVSSYQYSATDVDDDREDIIGMFGKFPIKGDIPSRKKEKDECRVITTSLYTLSGITTLIYADKIIEQRPFYRGRTWLLRNNTISRKFTTKCDNMYTFLHLLSKYCHQAARRPKISSNEEEKWQILIVNWLLSNQRGLGCWEGVSGSYGEDDRNLCTAYAIISMVQCLD